MTSWADRMGCTQDRANAINQLLHRVTGGADTTELWWDCWLSADAYAHSYGRTEDAVPRCARMLDIARHRARAGDQSADPTLRHVAITAVTTGTAGGYLTRADGTRAGERVDPAGLEFATPTPLER